MAEALTPISPPGSNFHHSRMCLQSQAWNATWLRRQAGKLVAGGTEGGVRRWRRGRRKAGNRRCRPVPQQEPVAPSPRKWRNDATPEVRSESTQHQRHRQIGRVIYAQFCPVRKPPAPKAHSHHGDNTSFLSRSTQHQKRLFTGFAVRWLPTALKTASRPQSLNRPSELTPSHPATTGRPSD